MLRQEREKTQGREGIWIEGRPLSSQLLAARMAELLKRSPNHVAEFSLDQALLSLDRLSVRYAFGELARKCFGRRKDFINWNVIH